MQQIIDIVEAQEAKMSVEEWFDIYGVVILKREEANQQRTGFQVMGAAAGR